MGQVELALHSADRLQLIKHKPNFFLASCLMSYHLIVSENQFTTFFPCDKGFGFNYTFNYVLVNVLFLCRCLGKWQK